MHWGFNPSSKTPPPLFCQTPHLNLQTVQVHPFFLIPPPPHPPIPACLKTGFFNFSVNIPVILKLFLLLNISDFSFFYRKTATSTPWKSHPLFPINLPLKIEILQRLPFLKIWLEPQSPLSRKKKGGGHTMSTLLNFNFNSKVFGRTSSSYYRTSYFLLIFTEFCGCSTWCMLVLFSIFLNTLENVLILYCLKA